MIWLWLIVPGAVALFGVLGVLNGVGHFFKGRLAKGSGGVIGGGLFAALGLAGSLLGMNMQTYSRLTYERPVAQVTIQAVDPTQKLYNVIVKRTDGGITQSCTIQGDEWLLAGRVQKWKSWATVVGLDSTYSLDQVANKYFTAAEGNGEQITSCDLDRATHGLNQFAPGGLVDTALSTAQLEDRRFGSASYMPLADGATYDVFMTQTGFNAQPSNDIAREANKKADRN
jgi:hypothetical protein